MFGSETALGIVYHGDDDVVRSPAQMDAYCKEHGEPTYAESLFPDGTGAVCCTNYAVQIGRQFPSQTQIFGFSNEENPDCQIVKDDLHPDGHDFAIVDERWLVDPWVRLVPCAYPEIVYDLHDPSDATLARARYGTRENWKHMTGAEEDFRKS